MKKVIDKILSYVLVALMTIIVLDVLWQVFSRYVIKVPSPYTDELARYLLIWIGVLGAAYASGQRKHLAITILETKLKEGHKVKLKIFQDVLIIAFSVGVLIIGGIRLVYITLVLEQYSAALNLPLSFVYAILPFSGLMVVFYKVLEILNPNTLTDE